MKNKKILILLAAASMILGGCGGNTNNSSNGNSTDTSSSSEAPIEESYKILVTAPSAITYEINPSSGYAKKGEDVTITIKSIADGYSISKATLNGQVIDQTEANVYKFKMPNRSASFAIYLSVQGDIVINGDFAANFVEENGIFVARNVQITTDGLAYFNYQVKDSAGKTTNLTALDFDYTKSFGDIQLSNKSGYALAVFGGATYDFYYDPANVEMPCYAQRTKIDVLPSTVSSLSSTLMTAYSVRSEHSIYKENLVGVDYSIISKNDNDVIYQDYNWKLYENNVSFAKIEDSDPANEGSEPMYVYKQYDVENKLYRTVDTYNLYTSQTKVNDDPYREDYNNYGSYSGVWDVMEGDDYGFRFAKSDYKALRNVRTSSHMPGYFIERDIMDAYRVGYSADEMTSYDIDIVPTATEDGFSVAVDSYIEYDCNGGTYTSDIHEAYIFDLDMTFDVSGALKTLAYKKTVYKSESQWDFKNHQPMTGVKGTVAKKVNATYTYGNVFAGAPEFDITPYFISKINSIIFYNPSCKKSTDEKGVPTDGQSCVAIGDRLTIVSKEGTKGSNCVKFDFEPATALDGWEYAPLESSDNSIITRNYHPIYGSCLYNEILCVNAGTAELTIGNHIEGTGVTFKCNVTVIASTPIWNFYLKDYTGCNEVDSATSARIKAGSVSKFCIGVHCYGGKGAALSYTAISSDSRIKVTSAPNSQYLVLDATAASTVTKAFKFKVTMTSDYYDEIMSPTVFEFTVVPGDVNPLGSWTVCDADRYGDDGYDYWPNTHIVFTNEAYDGVEGAKKGYVLDEAFKNGVSMGVDKYYFYYTFKNASLSVSLYKVELESYGSTSYTAKDFEIKFYYDPMTELYWLFLATFEIDDEYEVYYTDYAIGGWSDEYQTETYVRFTREN